VLEVLEQAHKGTIRNHIPHQRLGGLSGLGVPARNKKSRSNNNKSDQDFNLFTSINFGDTTGNNSASAKGKKGKRLVRIAFS
jgi:hypothetical protein